VFLVFLFVLDLPEYHFQSPIPADGGWKSE
jgi:hypothetical protein